MSSPAGPPTAAWSDPGRVIAGRLLAVALLVAGSAVMVAPPAFAKGPVSATIEDRGWLVWVILADDGRLQRLQEVTRFSSLTDRSTRFLAAPARTSPGYRVRYQLGDSNPGHAHEFEQVLYPSTSAGPLIYTPPGQSMYGIRTLGGWLRSPVALTLFLSRYGITVREAPAKTVARPAPARGVAATQDRPGTTSWPLVAAAVLVLSGLAALTVLRIRSHGARLKPPGT